MVLEGQPVYPPKEQWNSAIPFGALIVTMLRRSSMDLRNSQGILAKMGKSPTKITPSEMSGFTPIFDALIEDVGLITACVFGRMWRFCQMEDGVCKASLETIGESLGVNKATVMRHIATLIDHGYLHDLTPDLRNRPHVYADTGKVRMTITVAGVAGVAGVAAPTGTVAHSNTRPVGTASTVALCNSGVAENNSGVAHSNAGVAESHLNKVQETVQETFQERGERDRAASCAAPPTALVRSIPSECPPELAKPHPSKHVRPRWMGPVEMDWRIATYIALTGYSPNKVQESEILRAVRPDDPAWKDCIYKRAQFGCSARRVGDAVDDYKAGGPKDFKAQREAERAAHGSTQRPKPQASGALVPVTADTPVASARTLAILEERRAALMARKAAQSVKPEATCPQ